MKIVQFHLSPTPNVSVINNQMRSKEEEEEEEGKTYGFEKGKKSCCVFLVC